MEAEMKSEVTLTLRFMGKGANLDVMAEVDDCYAYLTIKSFKSLRKALKALHEDSGMKPEAWLVRAGFAQSDWWADDYNICSLSDFEYIDNDVELRYCVEEESAVEYITRLIEQAEEDDRQSYADNLYDLQVENELLEGLNNDNA